ncbi:MAG TPA: TfoX family protein [Gammaproteobacteria bacterium]|nr:TfoX family protein [Gammaproteobacteria bacterium]
MSASPEFIEYAKELFGSSFGALKEGKFFGGFAFKSGSKQFAMIMDNTLYFALTIKRGPNMQRWGWSHSRMRPKKVNVKKYYSAPEDLFADNEKLIVWAKNAIESAYTGIERVA